MINPWSIKLPSSNLAEIFNPCLISSFCDLVLIQVNMLQLNANAFSLRSPIWFCVRFKVFRAFKFAPLSAMDFNPAADKLLEAKSSVWRLFRFSAFLIHGSQNFLFKFLSCRRYFFKKLCNYIWEISIINDDFLVSFILYEVESTKFRRNEQKFIKRL